MQESSSIIISDSPHIISLHMTLLSSTDDAPAAVEDDLTGDVLTRDAFLFTDDSIMTKVVF